MELRPETIRPAPPRRCANRFLTKYQMSIHASQISPVQPILHSLWSAGRRPLLGGASQHRRGHSLIAVSIGVQPPPRAPTARAMTSSEVMSAAVAWMPMSILARLVRGMVSVGLNALEFVVDRYR